METKYPLVCVKLWEEGGFRRRERCSSQGGQALRPLGWTCWDGLVGAVLDQQKTLGLPHRAGDRGRAPTSWSDSAEEGATLVCTGGGFETVFQGCDDGGEGLGSGAVGDMKASMETRVVPCECHLQRAPLLHWLADRLSGGTDAVLDLLVPCGAGGFLGGWVHG